MDPYIGRTLDSRYEILERIGTGGMAVVYKAKDNRLGRLVAVKILRSDLAQDEDLRRRFNAESQAVAQLSSPHIVAVYDVSRGGDTEYIIMELIDGITLKQYMEKRGRLNWRESLHFITQIMRGLAHAHSKGIIHRDIKPQNIMVLRDGSVKVADFGIAVLENASQTLTQQALGSVHYISPEQARGERTDARSDIYSAGVVLYEMLTGRLPFEGESAVSVALQHLNSTPPNPRSVNPDIPEQLELICMKAMAQDRLRRYSSAEFMIQDLESFRKDPAISLDFSMADLRPEAVDEPTRPLRRQENWTDNLSPESREGDLYARPSRYGNDRRSREEWGARPARGNRLDTLEPDSRSVRREDDRPGAAQTILLCVGGVLALVLAFLLFRSILNSIRGGAPESYVVRSILGYTVDQARELDDIKGIFEIRQEGQKPSTDYPAGVICQQDPEPGRTRKGGNLVIKVWISTGEETALMPNVVH
ncbi:MAG: Stk1 family PASTA domain-containing Ser/Thr kinase, partial [Oscillibacter sp.]|nr:Stk1 family PASTA domain-containing Ser/Thr kinase [Oscillibacter sp.]